MCSVEAEVLVWQEEGAGRRGKGDFVCTDTRASGRGGHGGAAGPWFFIGRASLSVEGAVGAGDMKPNRDCLGVKG